MALFMLILLTHSWAGTLSDSAHRRGFWRDFKIIGSCLALFLGVPLVTILWDNTRRFPPWVVFAVALAIVAALLLYGWQKWWAWILTATVATVPFGIALGLLPLWPPFLAQAGFRGWAVVGAVIFWGVVVWWLPDRSKAWLLITDDGVVTKR